MGFCVPNLNFRPSLTQPKNRPVSADVPGTIISKEAKSMDFRELYEKAGSVAKPVKLSEYGESGVVGAAILTDAGNVYTGVCIDTACSMGFCA